MTTAPLAPVAAAGRIDAIDAVRGFALLGILCVNINTFGQAFGAYLTPLPDFASTADEVAHGFIKVFCEGKFYPLFSLLFGVGLTLQWQRAAAAGRSFTAPGLRRLAVLGVVGLVHALLLWYGDILFFYSTAGLLLLLLLKAKARTLATLAAVLLGISVLFTTGLAALTTLGGSPSAAAASAADPVPTPTGPPAVTPTPDAAAATLESDPFSHLMDALSAGKMQAGPVSPLWIEAETRAYRHGPWTQVMSFRILTYAMFVTFGIGGFWWHVAAMFLLGAALLKAGLFTPERRHWHRRFALLGALVGLPLAVVGALLPRLLPPGTAAVASAPLLFLAGPIVSLGYLGAITLLVQTGRARALTTALTQVGRMAMTNYLTQTVVATAIFYYWGLGLFGETTHPQRLLITGSLFAAQVALSVLWLRHFRFGPVEWLWRAVTYLRLPPMRRDTPPA